MGLSSDLLSQFAKATNDSKKKNTEATVCGTVRSKDGKLYVQIDGSDLLTPTESTVDKLPGERVMVQIKDHVATVIGNYTSPAARTEDVQKLIVDTEKIDRIEADNVQINERLEAAEGIIKDLDTDYLTADEADIKYATIEKLDSANANIQKLQTDKIDTTTANAKYANIDFSNIKMAAVEKLFTKSGIIENLVVGDTSITGELVGVTIKGDLIEGNTIAAEKLVVKGEDGLYYKLNLDGETVEAQQTNYNSLNGSIITAKSITASKINVTDLVAFGATIGGFKLSQNSIYSGSKSSASNTTSGIYLDKDGQLVVGDSTNFLKYYKDQNGNYKLEISANSMKLSSSNKDVETTLNEISEATQSNTNDLTNYITATNKELESLQGQIDGSIATWFYEYVPTNTNYPASGWTTTDLKNNHLGDLFYDTITGYCYRWQVQNNTYSWNRITDVDVTKALADAAAAQDTADNKRRVFVTTPTVPYDVGDLWVQGTSGDIMRCQTKKTSSQSYASADWVKASKYTDDTKANAAQTTANSAVTKINNLKIGGRNRLIGSANYNDFSCPDGDTSYNTPRIPVTPGEEITISYDVKSTEAYTGNTILVQYYAENNNNRTSYIWCNDPVTTEYVRQVEIITIPSGINYLSLGLRSAAYKVNTYRKIKVESGNRATDWTPAPEDIETRVTTTESSITQLSNKISTNVTSINNLGTRMTTIEQTSNDITVRIDTLESDNSIVTGSIIGYNGDTIPEGYEEVDIENVTNYMNFSNSGLVIGNMKATTLGNNVLIDNDSVDIRSGSTVVSSFGTNTIYLGKNSESSIINLCNGAATMKVKDNTDFRIYTDKRLVMSAYDSALIDCWRDSTHMTRIAIQSSDPDDTSKVGGVQFTIYQDSIQNTVQMLGNDIIHKVTDGTNTTYTTMHESIYKVDTTGFIVLNSKSTSVQIGDSSSYAFGIRLGSTYSKGKGINCYWIDGEIHDLLSQTSNGQTCYVGAGDIGEVTTTNVRGRDVRLYCHSGGGVYLGASGSTAITSDRNLKKDIVDINDKYINFFDKLRPITYKYNDGHRDHIGFVAQEVEEALVSSDLTTEQFAGLVIEENVVLNPNYDSSLTDEENTNNEIAYDKLYSLRYEEFISLLVKKVQNLQKQIDELKGE